MASSKRIRRKRLLREAEGYLDLATVYDRIGDSTDLSEGSGWYYLVRDDASADFGTDSANQPRTPAETPCP